MLHCSSAGAVATNRAHRWQSAVCAAHPLEEGTHYAEFTLLKLPEFDWNAEWGGPRGVAHSATYMGLVGAGFDVAGGGVASTSAECWMLSTSKYARMDGPSDDFRRKHPDYVLDSWNLHDFERDKYSPSIRIYEGDTVGLLLDLGQRTLSVYLNGFRLGVIVAPWIKPCIGDCVWDSDGSWKRDRVRAGELRGPLRWVVDVGGGSSWRIERKPPPPAPTDAETAAEIAMCTEWHESLGLEPAPAPEWVEHLDDSGVPHGEWGD